MKTLWTDSKVKGTIPKVIVAKTLMDTPTAIWSILSVCFAVATPWGVGRSEYIAGNVKEAKTAYYLGWVFGILGLSVIAWLSQPSALRNLSIFGVAGGLSLGAVLLIDQVKAKQQKMAFVASQSQSKGGDTGIEDSDSINLWIEYQNLDWAKDPPGKCYLFVVGLPTENLFAGQTLTPQGDPGIVQVTPDGFHETHDGSPSRARFKITNFGTKTAFGVVVRFEVVEMLPGNE